MIISSSSIISITIISSIYMRLRGPSQILVRVFRGLDSSMVLMLRGGIIMSKGISWKCLSHGIVVGIINLGDLD